MREIIISINTSVSTNPAYVAGNFATSVILKTNTYPAVVIPYSSEFSFIKPAAVISGFFIDCSMITTLTDSYLFYAGAGITVMMDDSHNCTWDAFGVMSVNGIPNPFFLGAKYLLAGTASNYIALRNLAQYPSLVKYAPPVIPSTLASLLSLNGNGGEYPDGKEVLVYGRDTIYKVSRSYISLTDNNAYTTVYDLVSSTGISITAPEALLTPYVVPVIVIPPIVVDPNAEIWKIIHNIEMRIADHISVYETPTGTDAKVYTVWNNLMITLNDDLKFYRTRLV